MRYLIIALCFPFLLTACGQEQPEGPVRGTYVDSDEKFEAEISDDQIVIYILGDDSKHLYWDGTWSDGEVVNSEADTKKLKGSLLGSGSKTKEFDINDGEVSFDFSALGSTTNITLEPTS